jgi:hypothetical protein
MLYIAEICLQGFDGLVVVVAYRLELAVEIGEPDVEVGSRLVNLHYLYLVPEQHRFDVSRPFREARLLEHSIEFQLLLRV